VLFLSVEHACLRAALDACRNPADDAIRRDERATWGVLSSIARLPRSSPLARSRLLVLGYLGGRHGSRPVGSALYSNMVGKV
jgi:hypothetical protein